MPSDNGCPVSYSETRASLLAMHKNIRNCKLLELVQYQCEVQTTHIECSPLVRLFLRCAGKPTIEVTPEYDQNGDPVTSTLPDFGALYFFYQCYAPLLQRDTLYICINSGVVLSSSSPSSSLSITILSPLTQPLKNSTNA
ncbi:hypothetical protein VTP01DRAFT_5219 [Rhizomucor pusillus]|uniref:uncharacterized protein n=1 Tax=Rhizomucor pusillus TaxID=4840 RepID=UPI0037421B0D